MKSYKSMPDEICVLAGGDVLVKTLPCHNTLHAIACPHNQIERNCTIRCARCSIRQEYNYWVLDSCGCLRYAKQLKVETTESMHRRCRDPRALPTYEVIPLKQQ